MGQCNYGDEQEKWNPGPGELKQQNAAHEKDGAA